ncbi:GNAT family N-acetyltransferase [Microbacterium sp. M3]|uniref:GNAT family N-acetyltransferase n=1 Tax=Microbacterium arthrosphaerae TaxID=792652 RepID=A0ABU4H4F8_9MICO|nr:MULTISPECIES: GNAT family N-acetyltransferase [Microbacterium]MDW4573569.1 GNAT family N-acetyltransferase [Microbacterium arthrosphaerae]MDW7607424.1 GNAT family N-acetyltransferase [Microbacterium sp. M3]
MTDGSVTLAPWGPDDLPLLERANTPAMTAHLGGPETAEQLEERHARYLRLAAAGEAAMYRIERDGVAVGGIGYWQVQHDGLAAWETGWNVFPEWQGRGIAREALRLVIREVAARGDRTLLVAYPGVDNPPSNALCRAAGFEHRGSGTIDWRGGELTFNSWVLDMTPLDLSGRVADVDETFAGPLLDETRWWPYYTPHWSSRDASAARSRVGPGGLELMIDSDTAPWAPELDGDLRVSHAQTGQFSGAVGSSTGQHRFRPGLVVREQQPERRLWLVHHGVIEVRLAAIRHPDAMVAFWPIGFEDRPDDCGELCIAEIFGNEMDEDGGWVGVGVKPQNDPRLREDFEKVRVDGDLTDFHDYAVEWTRDRVRFFIDGRWVKTVAQTLDYPVQFMLDVYEFPRADGTRDLAALPHTLRVERVRSFPPV